MALSTAPVECPACEGTGCHVDRFDPPVHRHEQRASPFISTDEAFTRKGYCYNINSKCKCCLGRRYLLGFEVVSS